MDINEKPAAEERIHHPYSPSKLQLLEACPKYASTFSESEAARTGTKQHNVAETGEDDVTLPDEKILAVIEAQKFVEERVALYPGCTVIKEDYLPIDHLTILDPSGKPFEGTTAGYLDIGIVSEDETVAEVIDYKFGKNAVEKASNNLQGYSYLLGLHRRFPKIKRGIVWFFMPHRDECYGAEFLLTEFEAMYLRIRTVVQRAVEAKKDPNDFSMAVAHGGCVFCDHIGRCPKVAEFALRTAKKYRPLEFPESISTNVFRDPAQITLGLKLAQVLKAFAEAYRSGATAKTIDDQKFIPEDYDLVQMSKRTVADARKLGEFAKQYLTDPKLVEEVEKLYDIPIGKLEKLIQLGAPRGQKEATSEKFGEEAVKAGLIKEGQPFAFLRQSKKSEK